MSALKPGIAALVVLAGLSGPARAQNFVGGGTYPGAGSNLAFYQFNGGFGNFGQPAIYPNYPGYGGVGYGARSRGYYSVLPYVNAPKTYNNMGGLMSTIQQQTGKPGSYRNSPYTGVSRIRRGR